MSTLRQRHRDVRLSETIVVYDVDEARKIVSDGRSPVELEGDDVTYLVDNSRIHAQHIDHVNTAYPGILAISGAPEPTVKPNMVIF